MKFFNYAKPNHQPKNLFLTEWLINIHQIDCVGNQFPFFDLLNPGNVRKFPYFCDKQ